MATRERPCRKMTPLALADVTIDDVFWTPRIDTNRRVTLPHEYAQCKETGRIDAFRLEWKPGDDNPPHIFWDSDLAKWIEAASYSLTTHPDPKLATLVNEVCELIASAQQKDGYLNVHFTAVEPEKLWANLRDCHELYCAGHLMEAAVAHHEATGSRVLLDALCRYADYIGSVFGPKKRAGYPGHEEIELALVKLYHATGKRKYLKLSQYFVDERGKQPHLFDQEAVARGEKPEHYWARQYDYCQAHLPVREQKEAVGHSVRAMYLYSGMADVAAETGDAPLVAACRRLWDSATVRRMYLTGGVGSAHGGERFTSDYDLPNDTAYAETCAAIGLVFFAHRMLQIEADGRYADTMERALYNGVLSGVSLDGKHFFYVNPLASAGKHHRPEWFGCACCPPNIARLLASLGLYVYSASDVAAYVHLYVGGSGKATLGGQKVTLTQKTNYPWGSNVRITVGTAEPASFAMMLRIPGWCSRHTLKVNGKAVKAKVTRGYARIKRRWKDGDRVDLSLAMPVERVVAHPSVAHDAGRVALQRGPLVYCLEECDNGLDVRSLVLPGDAKLTARFDESVLGGTTVIEGTGLVPRSEGWRGKIYRAARDTKTKKAAFKAIPYCLWDNRAAGTMAIWLPRT
ncbi:glycoside hydrolase family 127 protein [bacterium]|nr:glycoside hydrolase family 127 protein [bacterium]